ncbi:MAG: protein translocase subunit SecF [Chloroflexi bacterium]|nr:protein translocase subunit SecF [Chloroflexota bacterium]
MFELVQKRRWYFLISALLIVPSLLAMLYSAITTGSPVQLGIDFTSGSLLEVRFERPVSVGEVREVAAANGVDVATVQTAGDEQTVVIRTKPMEVETKEALKNALEGAFGPLTELRFESVGPTVGRETTRAAVLAILAASVAILFFIAVAFRKVPNAFRYGVCAIIKMFHDVLVILGLASILGLVAGWEVDSLFLTAMVTVVGFSVQDVIVVFDRIRENIRRRRGEPFETLVNRSLLETLHRSLATQLNAIFVMVAIIFFGGATIRQFMIVMLVGMVSGTYSSLFFAVPLLVVWERGELAKLFRPRRRAAA